jgi:cation transport protein ChaC
MQTNYIFAYGSLIWNPCFNYLWKSSAILHNYERQLCMYSWRARGTKENPGLVLGLVNKEGAYCDSYRDEIFSSLYLRENTPSECYDVVYLDVELINNENEIVKALCFVSKDYHEQYAKYLTNDEKIKIIIQAEGECGTTRQYLENTVISLKKEELEDYTLFELNKLNKLI